MLTGRAPVALKVSESGDADVVIDRICQLFRYFQKTALNQVKHSDLLGIEGTWVRSSRRGAKLLVVTMPYRVGGCAGVLPVAGGTSPCIVLLMREMCTMYLEENPGSRARKYTLYFLNRLYTLVKPSICCCAQRHTTAFVCCADGRRA